jgi:micrococcal nuclease
MNENRGKLFTLIVLLALAAIIIGLALTITHEKWWTSVKNAFHTLRENIHDAPDPGYYRVVEFADGDTIVVDMNGVKERVRFIGVDTPETQDPRKPVQCFGKAASDFTKNLIGTNDVRLEADPTNQNRDRYDRLLRYVYLPDGRLVQAEIIKQGYGFAYTAFPFQKMDEFRAYEAEARQLGRGLWGSCQVEESDGQIKTNDAT